MKPNVSRSFVRAVHEARIGRQRPAPTRVGEGEPRGGGVTTPRRVAIALVVLAIVIGAVIAAARPASARNDPKHFPVEFDPTWIGRSVCGFRIRVSFPVNRVFAKAATLEDGTEVWHVTGSLVAEFTSRHTTIKQNASGPADFVFAPNGAYTFDGRGLSIVWLTRRQQAETGMPGIGVYSGRTVVRFSPNGRAKVVRQEGHVVSLCDALA